ncbi:MAG: 4-hydroxythreonine-4-phosphate dehydrogenase PdxA [Gemmatimonadetes bacterium]|nr:4-hydroxythreonine-4-phosphate dehydrogenase PdxA [Gemmatimonadota bacterium]
MSDPRLVVTTGDPRGIGPEVTRDALIRLRERSASAHVTVIGTPLDDTPADALIRPEHFDGSLVSAGRVSVRALDAALAALARGEANALVTGPIHKPAFRAAGVDEPGHTEFLQRRTGAARVGMLMVAESTRLGGPLRVLLATTHIPLREVPERVTIPLLRDQIELLDGELRNRWSIPRPRIALCALNPHASDGGLFGDEEARILSPAADGSRAAGIDVEGPLPADTVFTRALGGAFDAVVAPYHDVGMAAFKTASFGGGVNVTLGLPFIRTSPDHGTAFDIAGMGKADPGSMLEALDTAIRLARVGRAV